jgi:1-acyl-sn-glycerol-3-phosphate acyltransferase
VTTSFEAARRDECFVGRDVLVSAITTFLAHEASDTLDGIRHAVEDEIDRAGPDALTHLSRRLSAAGSDWSYFPPDPLARRLHHVLAEQLLDPRSSVVGTEWLDRAGGQPMVLVCNHLSYADANIIEVLLRRTGFAHIVDRMTVVAGPKVYSDVARRFSSLCFGTIRVPQSSTVASEDAVMSTRAVARAARKAIDEANERCQLGEPLLLFPEGRRSRSGAMQALLPGASRYLTTATTQIVPLGLTGSDAMFPVGDTRVHSVPLTLHVGAPLSSDQLWERSGGNRRLVMDAIGLAVADLLPETSRGVYGEGTPALDEARSILDLVIG